MADTSSTPGPVPASSTSTSGAMAPDATVDLVSEAEPPAGPSRVSRAPRVSQIDAQELDEGLVGMLSGRLRAAGAVFGPHHPASKLLNGPSIHLLLQLVIYRLGVMGPTAKTESGTPSRATPGMRLQSLQLELDDEPGLFEKGRLMWRRWSASASGPISDSASQPAAHLARAIYLHPLLTLILPYAFERLREARSRAAAPLSGLRSRASSSDATSWLRSAALGSAEGAAWVVSTWQLVGWLTFLWDGAYPTLTSRLLRLRMVPSDPSGQVARLVSYEFMNRQLVWHGFTEFLLVLLPMLRSRRPAIKRTARRIIARVARLLRTLDGKRYPRDYDDLRMSETSAGASSSIAKRSRPAPPNGPYHSLPEKYCAICYRRLRPGFDHDLGLPEIEDPAAASDPAPSNDLEEAFVHVPAIGDCSGRCTYCYHCLAGEIARRAIEAREDLKIRENMQQDMEDDRIPGWKCLRCGDEVWKVSRSIT